MAPVSHLSNPLATPDQLSTSASRLDGVPPDLERSVLYAGARLTQAAGILLRLPQDIIAQAIVVYHRFWVGSEGGSLRQYNCKVKAGSLQSEVLYIRRTIGCFRRCVVSHGEALRPSPVTSQHLEHLRLSQLPDLSTQQPTHRNYIRA